MSTRAATLGMMAKRATTDTSPWRFAARTVSALRARGTRAVAGRLRALLFTGLAAGLPWTLAGFARRVQFRGERYRYLYHRYKHTWLTERAVEVPVVQAMVDRHPGRPRARGGQRPVALPRAAATSLSTSTSRRPGILNRDVLDLDDLGRFDLVVAISTLEHVGRDEEPRDPELAPEAVRRLEALVAPGGRLVVTVPIGYHPGLDEAFRSRRPAHDAGRPPRGRGSLGPHWREVAPDEVWGTPYDFLLYSARAVLFVGDRAARRADRAPGGRRERGEHRQHAAPSRTNARTPTQCARISSTLYSKL